LLVCRGLFSGLPILLTCPQNGFAKNANRREVLVPQLQFNRLKKGGSRMTISNSTPAPEITRRKLLASAAPLLVIPAAAVAAAQHQTPAERMAYHLAEFQRAGQDADPRIHAWRVKSMADQPSDMTCALEIGAFRYLGKFEGDGWYLIRSSDNSEPIPQHVSIEFWRGEKAFFLNPSSDLRARGMGYWMYDDPPKGAY
jgi:hypothetical protein